MRYVRKQIGLLVLVGCLILVGTALAADGFAIARSVIAGGGQEAVGGDFILNGTVGEPVAGVLGVGPAHTIGSGFWWPREFRVFLPLVIRDSG